MSQLSAEYVAGFFDGEGCIGLYKEKTVVTITQKFKKVLEEISQSAPAPGLLYYHPKEKGRCKMYTLRWNGAKARKVLDWILPHLRAKRTQAIVTLNAIAPSQRAVASVYLKHLKRVEPT